MFKIERDVTEKNGNVVHLSLAYLSEGVIITSIDQATGEVEEMSLSHEEADALYDLMFLVRPAYKESKKP